MNLFILTDNGYVPYEGGYSTVIGVCETRPEAVAAIKHLMTTDSFKWTVTDTHNKAKFVDGMQVETSPDVFEYYDNYDGNEFRIDEIVLGQYKV